MNFQGSPFSIRDNTTLTPDIETSPISYLSLLNWVTQREYETTSGTNLFEYVINLNILKFHLDIRQS